MDSIETGPALDTSEAPISCGFHLSGDAMGITLLAVILRSIVGLMCFSDPRLILGIASTLGLRRMTVAATRPMGLFGFAGELAELGATSLVRPAGKAFF